MSMYELMGLPGVRWVVVIGLNVIAAGALLFVIRACM